LGFSIEHFKGNTFYLNSLSILFQDRDYKELIVDILSDIRDEHALSIDSLSKRMLAYLACRSAVKAGDTLSQKQSEELVKKLEMTQNNATCPHGRPTKVAVDKKSLIKMFKR
jgi:DNA mismatch repair protein MutL